MDLTQHHFLFFIAQWSKQVIRQIQTQEGKKQTSSFSWCSTTELSAILILLTMFSFACTFFHVFIQMSPLQRGQFWPCTQNTFYFLNIILIFLIKIVHHMSYMLICLFSLSLWLDRCVFIVCSLFSYCFLK